MSENPSGKPLYHFALDRNKLFRKYVIINACFIFIIFLCLLFHLNYLLVITILIYLFVIVAIGIRLAYHQKWFIKAYEDRLVIGGLFKTTEIPLSKIETIAFVPSAHWIIVPSRFRLFRELYDKDVLTIFVTFYESVNIFQFVNYMKVIEDIYLEKISKIEIFLNDLLLKYRNTPEGMEQLRLRKEKILEYRKNKRKS